MLNSTALKAAFNSASFCCRFHGALIGANKKSFSHYVKNRKGDNVLRVDYSKKRGFEFRDNSGIIPKEIIFNFLRSNACN